METELSRYEFLNEDGHGQNLDLLEDDANKLFRAKQDFLDLMKQVRRMVSAEAYDYYAVNAEQWFDEITHEERARLTQALGGEIDYPISAEYRAWLTSFDKKHCEGGTL